MDDDLKGLTSNEAADKQQKFGKNLTAGKSKPNFFKRVLKTICEPMFLLLLIAAAVYFILGNPTDGAIMLIFVVFIIAIEIIQEWKADNTLQALKDLSEPQIKVIRDGVEKIIPSLNLVPGDLMKIAEGSKVPADGFIVKAFDLCIDESTLTGESIGVWKSENEGGGESFFKKNYVYAGTLVIQGSGYINVDKIGLSTEYGKIGKSVSEAKDRPTPLEKQTGKLVKIMAAVAAALFIIVAVITYFNLFNLATKDRIIQSILAGLSLAMAMIPEEFPVILTIFLSMGAWRLAKKKSLVRNISAVETLGAVSVLCVDKTGTVTKNQMTVFETVFYDPELVMISGLACEVETYDPMEKAILEFCEEQGFNKNKLFSGKLITEFSFTNELKMMGHLWEIDKKTILCAKGSPESILALCGLNKIKETKIQKRVKELSANGLRVIAVAKQIFTGNEKIPLSLTECKLIFCGLIALYDPPRESVKADIENCLRAGIRVVMITGDSGVTAGSIANEVGILNFEEIITGEQIEQMTEEELCISVRNVNIFSRVIPEHKTRIIKAFQANGDIVAMTGDGVNDAAALKSADIGIAMGKRGSEVCREAADLVLLDDNFSTIVDTVKDGRRIYQNIKKAIGYVLTIHIPIALIALIAPFIMISENLMLLPVHIVLLELVIDPTCSIVLERQKAERDIMDLAPRNPKEKLINLKLLTKSILQGLVIFAAAFLSYYFMNPKSNPEAARSMGIAVLMLSNLFLVYVNSSDKDFAYYSFKLFIKDKIILISNLGMLALLIIIIYTPLNSFLRLTHLSVAQIFIALGISIAAVFWYELVKVVKKVRKSRI